MHRRHFRRLTCLSILIGVLLTACGEEAFRVAGDGPSPTPSPWVRPTVDLTRQAAWGGPHPTASPEVHPTVDVTPAIVAAAPAGMADILACDSSDEWRAMATDLPELLPNLEPRPIEHPLPPEIRLAIFADPRDEDRRAVLTPREATPDGFLDGAAGLAAAEITGELHLDGWIVWGEARNGALPGTVWGAFDGWWSYGLFASDDELFDMLLDAAARAASVSCSL